MMENGKCYVPLVRDRREWGLMTSWLGAVDITELMCITVRYQSACVNETRQDTKRIKIDSALHSRGTGN
jgi:hypothetical protein